MLCQRSRRLNRNRIKVRVWHTAHRPCHALGEDVRGAEAAQLQLCCFLLHSAAIVSAPACDDMDIARQEHLVYVRLAGPERRGKARLLAS